MTDQNIKIELLYFNDCPSWRNAVDSLENSLKELGLELEVDLTPVETQEEAVQNEFTGSPMIRVNGVDLFPTGHTNYALGCRVYQTPDGYSGWPTEEMISGKLSLMLTKK